MVASIAPLVMLLLVEIEILVFNFAAVFAQAVAVAGAGAFKFADDLVTSAENRRRCLRCRRRRVFSNF